MVRRGYRARQQRMAIERKRGQAKARNAMTQLAREMEANQKVAPVNKSAVRAGMSKKRGRRMAKFGGKIKWPFGLAILAGAFFVVKDSTVFKNLEAGVAASGQRFAGY